MPDTEVCTLKVGDRVVNTFNQLPPGVYTVDVVSGKFVYVRAPDDPTFLLRLARVTDTAVQDEMVVSRSSK